MTLPEAQQEAVRAVFVVTDGTPARGPMNPAQLETQWSSQFGAKNIPFPVHTFGLGNEHCDDMLAFLATESGAVYCHVPASDKLVESVSAAFTQTVSVRYVQCGSKIL